MLLLNEKHEQLDVAALKTELGNLDNVQTPGQEDLENELGQYYSDAYQNDLKAYGLSPLSLESMHIATSPFSFTSIGSTILKKIKDFICKILQPGATHDEIIDAILDALSSIIPGGAIWKHVVKKLIKFIIDKGIANFCGFIPAP